MSFIVAIDGPAGAGKGTITKLVGEKLNLMNIDTGATYRCVTLAVIENGYTLKEEEKIVDLLDKISIEFKKKKHI
ncbi:MAG: (d)CMP kinase [Clostridia bacterium]